jgi:hypothetical protein
MSFCRYLPQGEKKLAPAKGVGRGSRKKENNFIRKEDLGWRETKPQNARPQPSVSQHVEQKIDVSSCDILFVDSQIQAKLRQKMSSIEELQNDLGTLLWILNNVDNESEKIRAEYEVNVMRRRIKDIEGGFELAQYLIKTSALLAEYRKILKETRSSFVMKENVVSYEKTMKKQQIIFDYLRIARNYIDLDNFNHKPQLLCQVCLSNNFVPTEDESIYVCEICGCQIILGEEGPSFKDTDRVNMAPRYTYTTRGHFIDCMNHFEGKENVIIEQSILNILSEEMRKHSLTSETARKDQIYNFMTDLRLGAYYENINNIFAQLTNTPPPDISQYRAELIEMNDQIDEIYKDLKEPERVNAQNVEFKLYKLLQLVGYPCRREDFFFLRTFTKEREHHEKWRELVAELQMRYPKIKASTGKSRWRYIGTF